ncbi:FlgK family flagellar hook-associated protein [Austwickia chelonae]|uniref:FlgK family flagellar hook-associated protein n=1 Tax=Austwickia chelonae TaxID=100225 RepID=UPI0013C2B6F2|nr:hypothetical protein [Austwickia chelonae]
MWTPPVGTRLVPPVVPVSPSLRVGTRLEGDGRAPAGSSLPTTTPAPAQPAPPEVPPLSPTFLRAQAVTGLLETRRADLVGADRQLAEPAAAVHKSLANVWPEETRDRPDARAAATMRGNSASEASSSEDEEKKARRARREADRRAELIQQQALQDVSRTLEDRAEGIRDRRDRSRSSSVDRDRPEQISDEGPDAIVEARARVASAVEDIRRLREVVDGLNSSAQEALSRSVAEINDLSGAIAAANGQIAAAGRNGTETTPELVRRREQLVVALARLTGATAQPSAGTGVDVLVDGRPLVTGTETSAVVNTRGPEGDHRITLPDGRNLTIASGVVASRLGTLNRILPGLAAGTSVALDRLAAQALDPLGVPVTGGPQASALLTGSLREISRAAESSAAYAQVAAGVEDLVFRLSHGDVPATARGSDLVLGALTEADLQPQPLISTDSVGPLNTSLSSLWTATQTLSGPGATSPATSILNGSPGLVSVHADPLAPAGQAEVRVVSVASGGVVASAQTFHPDSPLGDGRERVLGIVERAGTPQEHTTLVDIGSYPTPTDLVSMINQSSAGVRASLAQLGGGTVQVRLESLATGRGENITITNGSQPPSASSVLGRVVRLNAAQDTVVEIRAEGRAAEVRQTAGTAIEQMLPGVDLDVHRADQTRPFIVGVRRSPDDVLDRVGDLVGRAASTFSAAHSANALGTAGNVLTALGLDDQNGIPAVIGALAAISAPSEGGAWPGPRPAFPGLHLDRDGIPALNRAELSAAYDHDLEGTRQQVSLAVRALGAVAADRDTPTWEAYAAARAAQGGTGVGLYAPPDTHRSGNDHRPTFDLNRQERALIAVLAKLHDQGEWLGRQMTDSGR